MLHALLIATPALVRVPALAGAPALPARASPLLMAARDAVGLSWSSGQDAGGAAVVGRRSKRMAVLPSNEPSKAEKFISVQGNGMRTWTYSQPLDQARVLLETDGGPIDANVALQAPGNSRVQVLKQGRRIVSAILLAPPQLMKEKARMD